jgi:hypothetical protein
MSWLLLIVSLWCIGIPVFVRKWPEIKLEDFIIKAIYIRYRILYNVKVGNEDVW